MNAYQFFKLAKEQVQPGGRLAFLNADWRDFEGTSALDEDEARAISMLDYARLLEQAGWRITHMIDCPMSSERFNAGVVKAMQDKRILGTVRRVLLICKL